MVERDILECEDALYCALGKQVEAFKQMHLGMVVVPMRNVLSRQPTVDFVFITALPAAE